MSMVVQHNVTAMNAQRNLNGTTGSQSKSAEKLSSGYKINRAADDAAGLTISEKMRKQIKGLSRASTNAQDGISAVQTAEGALTEVHSMLQRMNELATQAANGTNSENDRKSIQDEIDQLTTEIDRVSETTKFNETYLLKGSVAGTSSDVKVNAHDAGLAGKLTDNGATATFKLDKALSGDENITIAGKDYVIVEQSTDGLNASTNGYDKSSTLNVKTLSDGDNITYKGTTYEIKDNIAKSELSDWQANDEFKIGNTTYTVVDDGTADTDMGVTDVKVSDVPNKLSTATGSVKILTNGGTDLTGLKSGGMALVDTRGTDEIGMATLGVSSSADVTVSKVVEKLGGGTSGLNAGDSVTISKVTTIATAETPKSAKDIASAISGLNNGKTVTIGTGSTAKVYEVADKSDESAGKLTREDIISKINNLDTVTYEDGGSDQSYTSIGAGKAGSNAITKNQAYDMIADELKKASSIGTDTAAQVINHKDGEFTITKGTVSVKDSLAFGLHVGADADMTNKINVNIDSMSSASLGIKGINVSDDTGTAATYAVDAIADAISKVSAQRSALGAVQNRLDHTVTNLDNVVENTTSAESRIRDTDMAEEMVEYSKNNILAQAGQSMLAQANQSTQGVLSILG